MHNGQSSHTVVPEGSLRTWIPHTCSYTRTFGKWQLVKQLRLECVLEPGNFHDKNAVAVEKYGRIIGYLPWKVSHVHALFLKTGGTVRCTVTGRR